jgi:hypothetical protein
MIELRLRQPILNHRWKLRRRALRRSLPHRPASGIRARASFQSEEYFLPERKRPVRMTGPSLIELSLPPYCGQRRLYLGRAVSLTPANYSVEELQ